eukprot:TRINITY_DN1095_c0_g1_i1.p2 TRINITY_DN1095_c0_g1~~TRINITY_DN1095_c0_g1_i1.p2  ORF type:complete len:135 (+),score=10.24 TRINITY_DN1095_c0_g1_i1:783-1187(+)
MFTGLLKLIEYDPDLMSVVLAHEIGHIVARHPLETASSTWYWFQKRLNTTHTKTMENEADFIGLFLMARACYNPEYAVQFWERMYEYDPHVKEDRTTHPNHETRINNLKETLPMAMTEYGSKCRASRRLLNLFQ